MLAGLQAKATNSIDIKLADGTRMKVEACADGIFRIQTSPRKDFSESLMIRYGVVRSDWNYDGAKIETKAGTVTISTADYKLSINKKNGEIKLTDASGNSIIKNARVIGAGDKTVAGLAKVINDKFSGMNVASNGGIIGDDNGKFSEKDKQESGDPDKSSIISISLEDGDCIYGGGSASHDHIQHRGELLRMWATYQHTEIPMPFMMSSRGWGVYDNSTRKSYFDVGSYDKNKLLIYNTFDEADFYLMAGDGMRTVLDRYTQVTGRPYVLPKWAYGLCFGPNMLEGQFDILNDALHFRQTDVPCDVFWLEPQWMEKRYDFSTSKNWNFDKFAVEPYWLHNKEEKQLYNRLFIGKLRNMGYHLGLWLCEEYDLSITEEDAVAAREGREQSGQEHWMDHLTKFLDYGVEGFKLDPARTIDEHTFVEYYNGRTDKEMHNMNQVLLPKQMAQMTRKHTGKRSWHHYCGGWAGTQHWGASTSGDNGGGKTALYDQLNLGMSGYMNTSCDVMSVPKEDEMMSLHFGLFLPWVQINSWFSMMHPFYYGEPEQSIYRDYVKLRYNLMPYIYSMALEGGMTGMPIVRSMPLVFPEDKNVEDMTYQYMFGDSFLLGIFTNEVYLPAGTWIDYWTGEKIVSKGETFIHEYPEDKAGLLFVREGSIIPRQPDVQYVGTKAWSDIILQVYPHGESSYTMLEDDGDSYEFENGAIAQSRFECSETTEGIEVRILPVNGTFNGMPQVRNYTLEIDMAEPQSVSVNGTSTEAWTFGEDGKVHIDLPACSLNDKYVVTIK